MDDILKIVYDDEEKTIVEVAQPLSNFQLAMYPFLTNDMDYITISKNGYNLAIVNLDGTVLNRHKNGSIEYTLSILWQKVEDFIWGKGVK